MSVMLCYEHNPNPWRDIKEKTFVLLKIKINFTLYVI